MGRRAQQKRKAAEQKKRIALVINETAQPWQAHARKLANRAKGHLGWNERREKREACKAAELAATALNAA